MLCTSIFLLCVFLLCEAINRASIRAMGEKREEGKIRIHPRCAFFTSTFLHFILATHLVSDFKFYICSEPSSPEWSSR